MNNRETIMEEELNIMPEAPGTDAQEAAETPIEAQADTEVKEPEKEPEKPSYNPYQFNPLHMALRPLYERAKAEDALFAQEVREKESRKEKPKSLLECAEYIMGEAYKYASEHRTGNFGLAGGDDNFIVGLIKHYYDEDDIKINKMGRGVKASVKVTKPAKKKQERPKETLTPGLTKMIRPESKREAKMESRKQADNVVVMDMFAGMWEEEQKPEPVTEDLPE